jgi:asparagine synthase (glutamine-hydrolysing)
MMETFRRDFTVEPMEMMARENRVQERAGARHLRVMLSGWGGDEAGTSREAASPGWSELRRSLGSKSAYANARRLGGMVRDLALARLPDSLYTLTGREPYLLHRAPCIQADFARQYRHEVREMRGPAWRVQPDVSGTICRQLEMGHITKRTEHWASSGSRHGIVYRYPMLDKRLVEFVVGFPSDPIGQPERRRTLFRRAVGTTLPADTDWLVAKAELSTTDALKREHLAAYADWVQQLTPNLAASEANRVVDPHRIRKAVRFGVRSGQLEALSGVREAFGCYAVKYLGVV